eukprot:9655544-Ditylum_brightwellii.AAC.1
MEWKSKGYMNPMDPNYHTKIDDSDFLAGGDTSKYRKMCMHSCMSYDDAKPDFSMHKIEEYDWFPLYGKTKEEELYGMPEPKSKPVVTSGFFDSSHASCLMTRSTPICWYSKRQNCVETSAYGSEIVAGCIAVDLAVEM